MTSLTNEIKNSKYKIGEIIKVKDLTNRICLCVIKKRMNLVAENRSKIYIHYLFFSDKYDKWIYSDDEDICNDKNLIKFQRVDFKINDIYSNGIIVDIKSNYYIVEEKSTNQRINIRKDHVVPFGYYKKKSHNDYNLLEIYLLSNNISLQESSFKNTDKVSKKKEILKKNGFKLKTISGEGGHCFFRCIIYSIYDKKTIKQFNELDMIKSIREDISDDIKSFYSDEVIKFQSNGDVNEYCNRVKNGLWAGQLEGMVCSKKYNLNIHLYEYKDNEINPMEGYDSWIQNKDDSKNLYLLFVNNNHYELLLQINEDEINDKVSNNQIIDKSVNDIDLNKKGINEKTISYMMERIHKLSDSNNKIDDINKIVEINEICKILTETIKDSIENK